MKLLQTLSLTLAITSFFCSAAMAQEPASGQEFRMELRAPFNLQLPTADETELAFGGGFVYYVTPQVHSEKYRSLFAEEVKGNTSMLHVGVFYEPRSDLRTGTRGYTMIAEGVKSLGGKWGAGGHVRYSSSNFGLGSPTNDYELGPQFSYWSTRRTYLNEKLSYRSIHSQLNPLNPANNPLIDPNPNNPAQRDEYVQLRHHLAYLIGEDYGFTYAHDLRLLIGILGTPHANVLSFYNYFIFSPNASFSFGPVVGVDLNYFVGRATSSLAIPVGGRVEIFQGPIAAEVEGGYTITTIEGQEGDGWQVRGVVGYRF